MNINEQVVHDLLTRQIDLMRYDRGVRGEVFGYHVKTGNGGAAG